LFVFTLFPYIFFGNYYNFIYFFPFFYDFFYSFLGIIRLPNLDGHNASGGPVHHLVDDPAVAPGANGCGAAAATPVRRGAGARRRALAQVVGGELDWRLVGQIRKLEPARAAGRTLVVVVWRLNKLVMNITTRRLAGCSKIQLIYCVAPFLVF
jgi:hypothetical protein